MADWTNLPNQAVGVGGLPSGTTVTALRDNPVAIAQGAAGAPKIQYAAIDEGLAQQPAGGVGTYAFLATGNTSGSNSFGSTRAGADLLPVGIAGTSVETSTSSEIVTSTTTIFGTWRCMGFRPPPTGGGTAGNRREATLWLRIA